MGMGSRDVAMHERDRRGRRGEQLALLRSTARAARARPPTPAREPAAELPVARVAVDVPLPHLDRPFDYLVPAELAEAGPARRAGAGAVRRPAGRRLRLERVDARSTPGRLASLDKVVSPEPVLSPGGAAAGPGGRRPLRRHAGRRAAAGRPAPARPGRGRSRRPPARRRRPPAGPEPGRVGAATTAAPALLDAVARRRAPPRGLVGAARPRPGRTSWPGWSPPPWPPGAARWSWCPTPATSTGSTPR